VLIPQNLREYAHLDKDIVLAGMLKNIEIWNKESFDSEMKDTGGNLDSYEKCMVDLGI
jgi:MraZ protein